MNRRFPHSILAALLFLSLLLTGCGPQEVTPLHVFFAGSMIIPIHEIEDAFEASHPNVDVLPEGHGSIQVVRHVAELHDEVDVAITADHALIPMLMYPATLPDTGEPYADWYIEFATNRLTLAYTDRSQYADEITADNWYEVVTRPGVRLGLADPRFDAAGYRELMAFQLAEFYYDDPLIFEDAFMGRFRYAITTQEEDERWVIHVPEIVEPKQDSGIVVRGGSIQLIALLESGEIDYAFEYESVSQQHGFRYVPLPGAVNMGSEAYANVYGRVEVQLDFQRFASVDPVFPAEFIGYGITIPASSAHPDLAAEFIAFMLGPEGEAIMDANAHPLIVPPRADGYERMPADLRGLCVPMP
ncbi:MAG: tungstate ABC transporter substrate-binding protein WtpA [Phycisphaerae bacterium]|nr:tungstate ABC transporter substrate-binding protein WtpA [Phycisphaerae bacterium]